MCDADVICDADQQLQRQMLGLADGGLLIIMRPDRVMTSHRASQIERCASQIEDFKAFAPSVTGQVPHFLLAY